MLAVDYFIWDELQVEEVLGRIDKRKKKIIDETEKIDIDESGFIHNDVRDKIAEIGEWLGFKSSIEKKWQKARL